MVDTLQILKDFVGVLTLRMLEWHSRQGARVYFMTSRALLLPRETGWLYGFSKNNPNIHYSLYTSQDESETSQATTLEDRLHGMHRNNHIKVFLTFSKRQPSASAFIAGGRNLSEMYFFDKQPDNSRFPDIVQWGKEPFYDWTYFDDVDFKVSDPAAVERVAQEMIAFNEKRVLSRPDLQSPQEKIQNGFLFASPFGTSKGQLESAYVELIDRAERSLQIYTPYVNLTSALRAALGRARNRGVDIEITTNINLQGDFMPGILQPAMTRAIRKEFGSFAFRYFSRPGHIMHVKAIVIDRRALVLGSVNLNRRSFNHDTEVSIIFNDRQTIESFDEQMSVDIRPWVSPLRRSDIPRKTIMEFLVGPLMGVM
ncbi:MAG: phosphatidylserine/phosphatidylglycerophosphate/cardiolipin synthase family protein [Bdellovibrionales bacterium]|nr:phosphatidylserine/phosphatidylglycerophosphate/cardiolipin synthase family protein [Bdellovibrionales bacterium]